jgi:hypothetical protein
MNADCTVLLPPHQPQLQTLTLKGGRNIVTNRALLDPLPLLR